MQRPSSVKEWQIPERAPLPTPEEGVLLLEPLEEHETSYFAAAERIEIFFKVDSNIHTLLCSINIFTTAQKCKCYLKLYDLRVFTLPKSNLEFTKEI